VNKLYELLEEIKELLESLDGRLQKIERNLKDVDSDYEVSITDGMHIPICVHSDLKIVSKD
jgi:hypothetical protein